MVITMVEGRVCSECRESNEWCVELAIWRWGRRERGQVDAQMGGREKESCLRVPSRRVII